MPRVYPLNCPIALYRMYSADGELLYIGQSVNPAQRVCGHRTGNNWITRVATMTLEWYPTREAAKQAEAEAIKAECPLLNVAHHPDERARRIERRAAVLSGRV